MKVKLLQLSGHRCYECGNSEVSSDITDWEELTEEEVEALEQWVTRQNTSISPYIVVKQIEYGKVKKSVKDFVEQAREALQKDKEREEARRQKQQ